MLWKYFNYYRVEPIPDMAALPPGARCVCRNRTFAEYIGTKHDRTDDCFVFCPEDGPPFRVYGNGQIVLCYEDRRDIIGRAVLRQKVRRWGKNSPAPDSAPGGGPRFPKSAVGLP